MVKTSSKERKEPEMGGWVEMFCFRTKKKYVRKIKGKHRRADIEYDILMDVGLKEAKERKNCKKVRRLEYKR